MFDNKPLLLGDLLIGSDPLRYGGQVADTIDIGLYATVVPGAPKATPIPCEYKCCENREFPNTDEIVPVNTDCANRQFTSATAGLSLPRSGTRSIIDR